MKLTKLLVAMFVVNQCDAVPDVVTVAKLGTEIIAEKIGWDAICKAATAVNPVAVFGIGSAAWTVSTVADSYFENQTKQSEERTKQLEEQTKQSKEQTKQLEEKSKESLYQYERISTHSYIVI